MGEAVGWLRPRHRAWAIAVPLNFEWDGPIGVRPRYIVMPVEDCSPRNWSLWATHPAKLGCIAECYPTMTVAEERAKVLRLAGYSAEVVLVKPGIGG